MQIVFPSRSVFKPLSSIQKIKLSLESSSSNPLIMLVTIEALDHMIYTIVMRKKHSLLSFPWCILSTNSSTTVTFSWDLTWQVCLPFMPCRSFLLCLHTITCALCSLKRQQEIVQKPFFELSLMSCSYRYLCHICLQKGLFLPLGMCFSSTQKADSSLNMVSLGSCSHSTYI